MRIQHDTLILLITLGFICAARAHAPVQMAAAEAMRILLLFFFLFFAITCAGGVVCSVHVAISFSLKSAYGVCVYL